VTPLVAPFDVVVAAISFYHSVTKKKKKISKIDKAKYVSMIHELMSSQRFYHKESENR